jgi:23S rRNA pseudouridine955/2504/2580 synthase
MKIIIDEKYHDTRVDRFLRKLLSNTPLTEIFKNIRTGNIKVNGKKTKENSRLKLGDEVYIYDSIIEENPIINEKNYINLSKAEIELIKSSIVYEDEKIVVINKPYNTVMHKGSGHDYGWSEMFKSYYKNNDFGFVNRIDKATSGLVIGAKTLPVARELSKEIQEHNIDKKYYILVEGKIKEKEFILSTYLKKIDTKVIESSVYIEGYKKSTSQFKVIENREKTTLLIAKLDTGRTHQLRVQLSEKNHPILGDFKYGAKIKVKRMFLHSFYLEIKKYNFKLELPLPEGF